ncbi:site-specific integrase [Escherichia coli]|nr:site-specific integrase [Escherichia coli]EJG8081961.1 site-specific integrase [Escherichia coli]
MKYPTGIELHNGKIRISFTYRGVRCREVLHGWAVTSSNIRKAGNLRAAIVSEIQLGGFDYAERFPESKALKKFSSTVKVKTFSELCDLYTSSKKHEISAATYDNLNCAISALRKIVGDNTLLNDIEHADMLNYRHKLLTSDTIHSKHAWLNKTGRAASTVNRLMCTLTGMMKLAYRSGFIKGMPYDGLKLLKRSKNTPDPLLHGEYAAVISALSGTVFANLWTIAIHTGLRHGELAALAWEDIDLNSGQIHISRGLTNKNLFVPPKTDAGIRTITLLKPAIDALREQFKVTGALARREITFHRRGVGQTEQQHLRFVFVPRRNARNSPGHYAKDSLAYSWENGLRKAGVRYRHPYQSRHTYACWSLSAGANPAFIASQMGHENAKMVFEVYGKWMTDLNQNQVEIINASLSGNMPPQRPLELFTCAKAL